jgi:hypothetical protein
MDPVRQGQRAAWTIFAVALGVYVLAAIVIRPGSSGRSASNLAMVAVGIGFFGLLAAWSRSRDLPPESRKAFWLTGLLCMALSGLLWLSICVGGMR